MQRNDELALHSDYSKTKHPKKWDGDRGPIDDDHDHDDHNHHYDRDDNDHHDYDWIKSKQTKR